MTPPVRVWMRAGRPCGRHCPCRGRTDVDTMPSRCCARWAAETAHRAEIEGDN